MVKISTLPACTEHLSACPTWLLQHEWETQYIIS